jgi:hypothetical protein
MHWRQRLIQIGLAGGLLVPACGDSMESASKAGLGDATVPVYPPPSGCNGNPDPCCVDEASPVCLAQKKSASDAGTGPSDDGTLADARGDAAGGNADDASPADAPTDADADSQSDTRDDARPDTPSERIDAETGARLPDR